MRRAIYIVGLCCLVSGVFGCRNSIEGIRRDLAGVRESVCDDKGATDLFMRTEALILDIEAQGGRDGFLTVAKDGDTYTGYIYNPALPELTIYRLRHAVAMFRLKRGMPIRKEDVALLESWDPTTDAPHRP